MSKLPPAADRPEEQGRGRPRSSTVEARLVTAGLDILRTESPRALTVERVCAAAGVARTTFYRRWRTINPIIGAIGLKLLADANPPLDRTASLSDELHRAARNLAWLIADPWVASLFRYAFALASEDEELRGVLQDLDQSRCAQVETAIEAAQQVGAVRPDVRPEFVAHQLFGPIWHRGLLLQIAPTDKFVDTVVDTVLGGIRAKG